VFNATLGTYSQTTDVNATLNVVGNYSVVKRPINLTVTSMPENATYNTNITLIANLYDGGLLAPAENYTVYFYVHDWDNDTTIFLGSSLTNSSGDASLLWLPNDTLEEYPHLWANFTLYIGVNGTSETLEKWTDFAIETRHKTCLESYTDEVMKAKTGRYYDVIVVRLAHLNGTTIPYTNVTFYLNGTFLKRANTHITGVATLNYKFETEGVYYFVGLFEGNQTWGQSNATRCVAVAINNTASIRLAISPHTFKDGAPITLQAQVINMSSYDPWVNANVSFYKSYSDNTTDYIGSKATNASGWAVLESHSYNSSSGVYAFLAKASYAKIIAVNHLTLTVASEPRLLLDVEKENTTNQHVLQGKLVSDGQSLAGKTIKLSVNGTFFDALSTDENGAFQLDLNCLTEEEKNATSYNIEAWFEGASPQNVTSYVNTANGTKPFCTTTYYSYKPAMNVTTLTVYPQSTDVALATKTPEELQTEQEEEGWLHVWGPDSFSLLPPFMKFHMKVAVDWLDMDVQYWIGLLGAGVDHFSGLGRLLEQPFDGIPAEMVDVVTSAMIRTIVATTVLHVASYIVTKFTVVLSPQYMLAVLLYLALGIGTIITSYYIPNTYIAKAVLYGIGFTLLALLIGGICTHVLGASPSMVAASAIPFAKSLPYFIQAEITGGDPIQSAIKAITNSFITTAIASKIKNVFFKDANSIPIMMITLTLAITAISLGSQR
jgi:hypothetical protein